MHTGTLTAANVLWEQTCVAEASYGIGHFIATYAVTQFPLKQFVTFIFWHTWKYWHSFCPSPVTESEVATNSDGGLGNVILQARGWRHTPLTAARCSFVVNIVILLLSGYAECTLRERGTTLLPSRARTRDLLASFPDHTVWNKARHL